MFRAATIRSYEEFSRSTGRRMGEALQKELRHAPDASWLFCAPMSGMEDLLKGICEGLGSDRIVGCTTSGEISSLGLSINSAVLGGIVTDRIDFEIIAVENLNTGSAAAGRKLAASFSSAPHYLQIFSDGLTGNGCAILRGIADVLGNDLPVAGGAAGDNGEFRQTLQFSGGKIYKDALCGIAFHGDFRLGTGVCSGWAPIGLAKQVTKARGKVVYELNGEPALNVFERFLGQHAEKLPAIGVEYPLGFTMPSNDANQRNHYVLRATMSVDRKERSITFAGEIPEGALVNLTCGDKPSILAAADTAAKEAKNAIGEVKPEIIFCYSCMARKIVLGGRTKEEIERIQTGVSDKIPMIGFYTYGEFCPIGPMPRNHLHNETITLSVLGLAP